MIFWLHRACLYNRGKIFHTVSVHLIVPPKALLPCEFSFLEVWRSRYRHLWGYFSLHPNSQGTKYGISYVILWDFLALLSHRELKLHAPWTEESIHIQMPSTTSYIAMQTLSYLAQWISQWYLSWRVIFEGYWWSKAPETVNATPGM